MSTPAGWFPDPQNQGQRRYWDGNVWTDHRAPSADSPLSARSWLAAMPFIPRCILVGATVTFILGGLVGLVLGLRAYPGTAWFAVLEVGVPAGVCGAALGAVVGLIGGLAKRISHH